MNPFETSHSLLNAKFEGYKLEPVAEDTVQRYPLEHKPTQIVLSNRSPLTFQEVQSRITHNHLCMSANGERALYIDAEYKVVLVQVDKVGDRQLHDAPHSQLISTSSRKPCVPHSESRTSCRDLSSPRMWRILATANIRAQRS